MHAHHKLSRCTLAYLHPLNKQTVDSLHSLPRTRYLPHSAAIKFLTFQHAIQTQHCLCTPQLLHTRQTMFAMLSSNCVAATHNTTSATLLMHTTNTRHSRQNGTRCRDGVKVVFVSSHLVWMVFEGSILCFHLLSSETFCDLYVLGFLTTST